MKKEIKLSLKYCSLFAIFGFIVFLSWIAIKGVNLNDLFDFIIIELILFIIPFPAMYGIAFFQINGFTTNRQEVKEK